MVYLLPTPYVVGKVENTAKNDRGLSDFPKLGIQPAFDRSTFQADSSSLFCQNSPSSRFLRLIINIEYNFSRYRKRGRSCACSWSLTESELSGIGDVKVQGSGGLMVVHGRVVLFLAFSVSAWVQCGPVVRAQVRTDTTIVANVELVQVPVTIFDDKGAVAAHQHRAMIIITDGGDNHSRYNLRETREFLEEADIPVFAVMAGPSFELPEIFVPQRKKQSRFPSGGSNTPFPKQPISVAGQDYIGPAERRGPHNMKVLTETTGGGVFTARDGEDLPRIVRTIGLAVRYRYVLTYRPVHGAGDASQHKVVVQLYPKEKFRGYSLPYYKRSYHSIN